jgi:hypothetical protein
LLVQITFVAYQRKSHYNYRDDFALEKFEKVKILVYHIYVSKMNKNYLQGLKNLRKTILNVLTANLDENLIFEKKVTKFTPKYRNFRYF